MPTTTPFAFHSGTGDPAGTQRIGNIIYGRPDIGFGATGLKWWNGPDEDLGYVIAIQDSEGNSTGADGQRAYLNFSRSAVKTEASFIEMVNAKFSQTFTTGNAAKSWLNANGYWTSWGTQVSLPSSGAFAYNLVVTPYEPPASGAIIFPVFSNNSGPTNEGILDPNTFEINGVWWNKIDSTSTDRSDDFNTLIGQDITISFTQNGNTAIYNTNGIVLNTDHFNWSPGVPQFYMTLVQASPVNFNAGELVTIAYTIN